MEYGGLKYLVSLGRLGCQHGSSPHVSWEESKNRVERNLIPHHLVGELGVGHLTCVLVRPSVAGNLVALGMHPLFMCE